MKHYPVCGFAALAAVLALAASPVMAQKNYTDGGDLYGGAHTATTKDQAKKPGKTTPQRSQKFDPYTDGTHAKSSATPAAKKFPDERPQPDDVARTGKLDPYTEGQNK